MAIEIVSESQFTTTFCLRPSRYAWFLGAGASASAGIPTGYAMIVDFKKRLFCQMSGISRQDVDANDPLWMERIDHFLGLKSVLPPPGDPTEYAKAFEAVFPTPEDRRLYIDAAVRKGTPAFAHRVLASLLTAGKVPCVFTTNFDSLVETAATVTDQLMPAESRANLTVAAIDNVARAALCLSESRWPLLSKIHGDFQSVELKNTTEELKVQDSKMRGVLTASCSRFGLVIVGYSGRDESVMAALTDALSQPTPYPAGIYWVARSSKSVLPSVVAFLDKASGVGVKAAIVESQTFDELAAGIADGMTLPAVLVEHIHHSRPQPVLSQVPLPSGEKRSFPVLQCSGIPILEMPRMARRVVVEVAATTAEVRKLLRDAGVRAVVASTGTEIAAFGEDESILRGLDPLRPRAEGTLSLDPEKDSWALGLLYDAFVRSVCRDQSLFPIMRRRGHVVVVAKGHRDEDDVAASRRAARLTNLKRACAGPLYGMVPNQRNISYIEGVELRLEQAAGRWWCVFEPTTHIELPKMDGVNTNKVDGAILDWRRERWAKRYNQAWARILAAWVELLAGEEDGMLRVADIHESDGVNARFRVSAVTAWSRPSHDHDYFRRGV